ncbi:hypothetical protein BSKO_04680 [Bryopsis sp. KO-2023]|nr:hypothetical protein BSKO_04680 [Bryopsis sp. KO-2023]
MGSTSECGIDVSGSTDAINVSAGLVNDAAPVTVGAATGTSESSSSTSGSQLQACFTSKDYACCFQSARRWVGFNSKILEEASSTIRYSRRTVTILARTMAQMKSLLCVALLLSVFMSLAKAGRSGEDNAPKTSVREVTPSSGSTYVRFCDKGCRSGYYCKSSSRRICGYKKVCAKQCLYYNKYLQSGRVFKKCAKHSSRGVTTCKRVYGCGYKICVKDPDYRTYGLNNRAFPKYRNSGYPHYKKYGLSNRAFPKYRNSGYSHYRKYGLDKRTSPKHAKYGDSHSKKYGLNKRAIPKHTNYG